MLPELQVYDHRFAAVLEIISLANSKLILGIKSLFVNWFSKFCCKYYDKFSAKYCWENIFASLQIKYKLILKIHSQEPTKSTDYSEVSQRVFFRDFLTKKLIHLSLFCVVSLKSHAQF